MTVMDVVPFRRDYGISANKTAENLAILEEELYRQIAAFAEKSWREVSVSQSLYDDYIRDNLEKNR